MTDVLEKLEIMFPKNMENDSDEGSNADSDFSGDEIPDSKEIVSKKSKGTKKGVKKGGSKKKTENDKTSGKVKEGEEKEN